MKEIKAYVRPEVFDDLYAELKSKGYCCMTVTDSEGVGNYIDPDKEEFPNTEIPYMHSKVFKIEIMCTDDDVTDIIDIIKQHGRTGNPGDGIICVIDIKRAVPYGAVRKAMKYSKNSRYQNFVYWLCWLVGALVFSYC